MTMSAGTAGVAAGIGAGCGGMSSAGTAGSAGGFFRTPAIPAPCDSPLTAALAAFKIPSFDKEIGT
jgi:hypothetical protein